MFAGSQRTWSQMASAGRSSIAPIGAGLNHSLSARTLFCGTPNFLSNDIRKPRRRSRFDLEVTAAPPTHSLLLLFIAYHCLTHLLNLSTSQSFNEHFSASKKTVTAFCAGLAKLNLNTLSISDKEKAEHKIQSSIEGSMWH